MIDFLSVFKGVCRTAPLYTRCQKRGKNHFHKKCSKEQRETPHLLEKTLKPPFWIAPGF